MNDIERIATPSLKGRVGAVSAGLFYGAGEVLGHGNPEAFGLKHLAKTAAHAAIGCAQSTASGGRCAPGAMAAGFASFAGPIVLNMGTVGNGVARAVIGGVAAKLGGGKFENGAVTAAFGYLFNECGAGGCWESDSERSLRAAGNVEGYWGTKCDAGEPFACTALGVVRNDGILGKAANTWLGVMSTVQGVDVNPRDISVDLMNRYGADQQATSSAGNPRMPSVTTITMEHYQTFQKFGLPSATFGATPLAGTPFRGLQVPGSVWCRGCAP